MKTNYKYLMELKSYPLGDAVLDNVIKRISPSLSSELFDSDGEKDGYISWLTAPINCEGGLELCQV